MSILWAHKLLLILSYFFRISTNFMTGKYIIGQQHNWEEYGMGSEREGYQRFVPYYSGMEFLNVYFDVWTYWTNFYSFGSAIVANLFCKLFFITEALSLNPTIFLKI